MPRNARVRVVPLSGPPRFGDVVLLKGRSRPILHRVVGTFTHREEGFVLHRGDAGGGIGLAPCESVVGQAVEVLSPPGQPFPSLARLSARQRAALRRARRRGRLYVLARRLGYGLGLRSRPLLRSAARWFWRLA